MTIDLFTIKATDTEALVEVIGRLAAHCDVAQVEQFLEDLSRWHNARNRSGRAHDEAQRELEEWQRFISSLPEVPS